LKNGLKRVLFVCVENSCRTQIAEAFSKIHGSGIVEAYSAGSRPSGNVNPKAIESMLEVGYSQYRMRDRCHNGCGMGSAHDLVDRFDNMLVEASHPSKVMLCCFAGNRGLFGRSNYEFFNIAADIPVIKVFFRDTSYLWYQRGISDTLNSLDAMAQSIRDLRESYQIERMVMFGGSGGGYAAIALGILSPAEEVHAFNPQTRLKDLSDSRTPEDITRLKELPNLNEDYLDLWNLFKKYPKHNTVVNIYYSEAHDFDRKHARRLVGARGVRLHPYNHERHDLLPRLMVSGELKQILLSACPG